MMKPGKYFKSLSNQRSDRNHQEHTYQALFLDQILRTLQPPATRSAIKTFPQTPQVSPWRRPERQSKDILETSISLDKVMLRVPRYDMRSRYT